MSESSGAGPPRALRAAMIRGAGWTFAMRWATRVLGLVSTAILARLLSPNDFGLLAMAMIVVGFVDSWINLGIDNALIQDQRAGRADYDTAWTLRVLQGVAAAVVVLGAAPFAASYFRDERIVPLLAVLSAGVVVAGCANIGVVAFRKELTFEKEFRFQVFAKLLAFPIVIAAAVVLRSFWALAIGIVAGYVISTGLSYLMHPYRPRWCLERWRHLWSYSKWMVLRSIGHFAETRADEILVGGHFSAREMGLYNVASELGQLPGSELAAPLNNAMLPTFAKMQDDPERMGKAFAKVVGVVGTLAIPAGAGIAVVAEHLVPVLLGDQWGEAVSVLAVLAIYGGMLRWKVSLVVNLSLAVGRPSYAAAVSWFSLLTLVPIAWAMLHWNGIVGIAIAKILAGALLITVTYFFVNRMVAMSVVDLLANLWRPYVATLTMCAVVASLPDPIANHALLLIYKSVVGTVVYILAIALLWLGSGRPDGAELIVCEKIAPGLLVSAR